jgi:hypothetical protein
MVGDDLAIHIIINDTGRLCPRVRNTRKLEVINICITAQTEENEVINYISISSFVIAF